VRIWKLKGAKTPGEKRERARRRKRVVLTDGKNNFVIKEQEDVRVDAIVDDEDVSMDRRMTQ
jgi:hypothetical protein